ncbi:MAG: 23S rRNA (pseudouridine(1915)-N(3))-methyltransferase RlmH [Alphaproteobacteria bacterium]|nr:23S rRNA (pseudouridine(1915)-N(3))-methyltransferase RlmH [Alphaproteobacteria bacterium]
MKIVLAAAGRLKAGPERDIANRYLERAQAAARSAGLTGVDWREIEDSKARRAEDRKSEEGEALLALAARGARIIALDERGKTLASETFAADIGRARDDGAPAYVLVIGGADGLPDAVRAQAALTLSFGAMTWPHQLVRIMALEQVYRAITILTGHPYHRA